MAGWLSFFCTENAEEAEALCEIYPWLLDLYVEMARFKMHEELIGMFSEMLREMDRNAIRYMVDEMKEQIEKGKVELTNIKGELADAQGELAEKINALAEKDNALAEKDEEIARLKALLGKK